MTIAVDVSGHADCGSESHTSHVSKHGLQQIPRACRVHVDGAGIAGTSVIVGCADDEFYMTVPIQIRSGERASEIAIGHRALDAQEVRCTNALREPTTRVDVHATRELVVSWSGYGEIRISVAIEITDAGKRRAERFTRGRTHDRGQLATVASRVDHDPPGIGAASRRRWRPDDSVGGPIGIDVQRAADDSPELVM